MKQRWSPQKLESNLRMETKSKKIDDGIIELSVTLSKLELNGYVKEIEDEMLATVSVDGFRKGKAPQELARQKINKEEVREIALQAAISGSLKQIISEQNLDVAGTEKLKVKENTAEKLTYSVELKTYPNISLPDLSVIKVSTKPIEVSEKEVQEALDVVRNMRASFTVKETTAEKGDRVEVDFQVFLDGKLIEGGESRNHPLIIGGKSFIPGFEEQLIGLKANEEKEFSLVAPQDYYQKKIAGKKLDFKVKVTLVQSVHLPQADDEFAKTSGRFKNLKELNQNIADGLKEEKRAKERDRIRLEILDAIVAKANINPPKYLVEEQLESMIDSFDRDLHAKGLELPMYLANLGKKIEDLKKDWQPNAEKQTKIILVLRAFSRKEGIVIDEQEIENSVQVALQSVSASGQNDLQNIDMQELRGRIAERLLQEKTLQALEARCVV